MKIMYEGSVKNIIYFTIYSNLLLYIIYYILYIVIYYYILLEIRKMQKKCGLRKKVRKLLITIAIEIQ